MNADLVALARQRLLHRDGRIDGDVGSAVDDTVRAAHPLMTRRERDQLGQRLTAELVGLGPLEPLLADPDVSEVMVNAGREVWVDRGGATERAGSLAAGQVDALLERIIGPLGLRVDRTSPIVDARLADGSRVSAVVAPLAVDGTCLTIRRFRLRRVELAAFAPAPVAEVLHQLVEARCNVVVTGATSSGKTTLLNALAADLPDGERVVTIEDTAELSPSRRSRGASRGATGLQRRHRRERRCATSSAPRCGCAPTGWWSARCAVRRRSTWCRPSTRATTVRCRPVTPTVPSTRCGVWRRWCCKAARRCRSTRCATWCRARSTRWSTSRRGRDGRRRVTEVVELMPPGCDPSCRVRLLATATGRGGEISRGRTP